jgi:hypothetical protein
MLFYRDPPNAGGATQKAIDPSIPPAVAAKTQLAVGCLVFVMAGTVQVASRFSLGCVVVSCCT